MNFTPVRTPLLLQHAFRDVIWNIPNEKKVIYLTFDDGPTPEVTDWTLNTLDCYRAKATFFCVGENVKTHPDIFERIKANGHAIGNHTHNHIKGWKSSTQDYLNNIEKASSYISSKLFRPPYGQIYPRQIAAISKLKYKIIMWTILSLDWNNQVSKEKCLKNVIDNSSDGDIIVFHDSIKASNNMMYTLPKVLEYFSKKGFEFKRIPESIL